ncbi:MAG: hypothetical protein WC091_18550 [Sulfuricellaceae bacterium]
MQLSEKGTWIHPTIDGDVGKIAIALSMGLGNFAVDATSRAYLASNGGLNFDIIKDGPQLGGMNDLKLGDVLLKQGGIDIENNVKNVEKHGPGESVSLLIDTAQIVTNRSNHKYVGAGLLGHAAIYVGEGKIAEAIGEGCKVRSLGTGYNADFNFYAIRPHDGQFASKIAQLAQHYASSGKILYSYAGLIPAVIGGTAASRHPTKSFFESTPEKTENKRSELDSGRKARMFCSEFVAFILNCAADDLSKQRVLAEAQNRITPEEIYVTLRENPNFSYAGELRKHVR